jgi:hypothetical protein
MIHTYSARILVPQDVLCGAHNDKIYDSAFCRGSPSPEKHDYMNGMMIFSDVAASIAGEDLTTKSVIKMTTAVGFSNI